MGENFLLRSEAAGVVGVEKFLPSPGDPSPSLDIEFLVWVEVGLSSLLVQSGRVY